MRVFLRKIYFRRISSITYNENMMSRIPYAVSLIVILIKNISKKNVLFQIISNIIENILDLVCPTNLNDGLRLIKKVLKVNSNDQLYLIIHNLDGIMLRSNKAQDALAALTAIPNVRLLASVDHINAPLRKLHLRSSNERLDSLNVLHLTAIL